MITVTLQQAKAKLNSLVEAAISGEDVILLRGAQIVARIQPLNSGDIELSSQLSDKQAEKFWKEIDENPIKKYSSPDKAIQFLKK